jgi:hypothetical protein
MGTAPHTVAPMSLAEARRMISDPHFAESFDQRTRELAWQMVHAHRRGQSFLVVVFTDAHPTTPGDAA